MLIGSACARRGSRSLLAATFVGLTAAITAQTPLGDLNTAAGSGSPGPTLFTTGFGGPSPWFVATSEFDGNELWTTDGTAAGTRMLFSAHPGRDGFRLPHAAWLGSSLILVDTQDGAERSRDVWITDGTPAGSRMLARLRGDQSFDTSVASTPNRVLFTAAASGSDTELWSTDGTPAGTQLLVDILGGATSSGIRDLVTVGDHVFFVATSGVPTDGPLWISDGTVAGTRGVGLPNSLSALANLTPVGDLLFFTANEGGVGIGLFRSDGTAAGTFRVGPGASTPRLLTAVGARLFVTLQTAAQPGLWVSDGTVAGTTFVSSARIAGATVMDGLATAFGGELLYFSFGRLMRSDGTPAGTTQLALFDDSLLGNLTPTLDGSRCFFAGTTGGSDSELWITDGTPGGTQRVIDLEPGAGFSLPSRLTPFGDGVLFRANGLTTNGGIYVSDGTAAGTRVVRRDPPANATSNARGLPLDDRFVLRAEQAPGDDRLWLSDGTAAGTQQLATSTLSLVTLLGTAPGQVLFSAATPDTGTEPWVTDGTSAGTHRIADLAPGFLSSTPTDAVRLGARWIFSAFANGSRVPYASDGNTALRLFNGSSNELQTCSGLASVGSFVLFSGSSSSGDGELWRTDGTVAGTGLCAIIRPGVQGSFPAWITPLREGLAIFGAHDGVTGTEPWLSDGTAAGTALLTDLRAGADGSDARWFTPLGDGRVVFAANNGTTGLEPFVTDGTPAGTQLLRDIRAGLGASFASNFLSPFVACSGRVVFLADDGVHGLELWSTDGTPAGTQLVVDVVAGPANAASPTDSRLVAAGDTHALVALNTAADGTEVWITDGTAAGTRRVTQFASGPEGTLLGVVTAAAAAVGQGVVLVELADPVMNREPFVFDLAALEAGALGSVGVGCAGTARPIPTLGANRAPRIGDLTFSFTIHGAPSNPAAILIGPELVAHPDFRGCTLLVDQWIPLVLATDAAGRAAQVCPVPSDVAFVGARFWAQCGVIGGQGPFVGADLSATRCFVIGG